ncbi:hypothetical protein ACFSKL_07630 [Belliella marina]|uniref:Uncharacterized protein n=1 Tax=Belliella marina TaxID=1644146 RepID=A0ABW4VIY5_9BACT
MSLMTMLSIIAFGQQGESLRFGQQNKPHQHSESCGHVKDNNPVRVMEGKGYNSLEDGVRNQMRFSGTGGTEVSLRDNEVIVHKTGVYKISVSTDIDKDDIIQKRVNYEVVVNGKEAFQTNSHTFPSTGVYSFQVQLKENDRLCFNLVKIMDEEDNISQNKLTVQFTDPALISYGGDQ